MTKWIQSTLGVFIVHSPVGGILPPKEKIWGVVYPPSPKNSPPTWGGSNLKNKIGSIRNYPPSWGVVFRYFPVRLPPKLSKLPPYVGGSHPANENKHLSRVIQPFFYTEEIQDFN